MRRKKLAGSENEVGWFDQFEFPLSLIDKSNSTGEELVVFYLCGRREV